MSLSYSIRELVRAGVVITHEEAIAVVQEVIVSAGHEAPATPPGPPSLENVHVTADGSVRCTGFAATPAVSECAIFLDAMLPRPMKVPGGVRYVIARALLEVDAPPFDSVVDLSVALARYERGARPAVLRQLVERASAAAPVAADALVSGAVIADAAGERRRATPSAAELRRQLRDADAALFAQAHATSADATAAPAASIAAVITRGRAAAWASAGAVAAMIAFGAGYVVADHLRHKPPAQVATRTADRPAKAIATMGARTTIATPGARPTIATAGARTTVAAVAATPTVATPTSTATADPAASRTASLTRVAPAGAGSAFSPSFSTDGTAVFFHDGRPGDSRSSLERASLAGDDLRVMTIVDDGSKNYHVQPSPDGARVAFDSDRDGERGVYVAERDGTGVQRVSGPGYAAVPSWSPDGGSLAFVRGESSSSKVWNLWLLQLASGKMQRLTGFRFGQTWGASWFPDGMRIAYTHEDRLFVRDLARGSQTEYPSPVASRLVRTPAVSPDGRYVIFQVARAGAWLLDLRSGSMRCVLADPTAEEFAWAPDGRRVAFHSRRDGQWGIWAASGFQ